jgi:hypothetical protein
MVSITPHADVLTIVQRLIRVPLIDYLRSAFAEAQADKCLRARDAGTRVPKEDPCESGGDGGPNRLPSRRRLPILLQPPALVPVRLLQ